MGTIGTVSYEDLVAALRDARMQPERPPGVFRRGELEQLWGMSQEQAYRHALALCKKGLLKRVWARLPDEWGIWRKVPAYQLVAETLPDTESIDRTAG